METPTGCVRSAVELVDALRLAMPDAREFGRRDGPFTVHNLVDPPGRHTDIYRHAILADTHGLSLCIYDDSSLFASAQDTPGSGKGSKEGGCQV